LLAPQAPALSAAAVDPLRHHNAGEKERGSLLPLHFGTDFERLGR